MVLSKTRGTPYLPLPFMWESGDVSDVSLPRFPRSHPFVRRAVLGLPTTATTATADAPPAASRVGYVRMAELGPRMHIVGRKSDAKPQKRAESVRKV